MEAEMDDAKAAGRERWGRAYWAVAILATLILTVQTLLLSMETRAAMSEAENMTKQSLPYLTTLYYRLGPRGYGVLTGIALLTIYGMAWFRGSFSAVLVSLVVCCTDFLFLSLGFIAVWLPIIHIMSK